ncbi:hypothetical protein EVAR_58749_1 [Eumeta japonica]|uniref:Uncharacterized protein n=1 Tax=Eumeta variegata TaxID=151549 RepID=A0A4C1ZAW8_EUMVA|nr:hypothetical protein EVAR_58749_1 [Eumeta japonica]
MYVRPSLPNDFTELDNSFYAVFVIIKTRGIGIESGTGSGFENGTRIRIESGTEAEIESGTRVETSVGMGNAKKGQLIR